MSEQTKHSPYMEWAKLRSSARFNLATSGIPNVPLREFPLDVEDLEITIPRSGYGYEPLLERIARHTGAPQDCVVTAIGTSLANHLAMAAVLERDDEVLIEEPAYGPLLEVARYLGARVTRFQRRFENGFAVEPEAVAAALTARTRLVVLTNFHNPSGGLIPRETLRALADMARQRAGLRILVDEVYLEYVPREEAPYAFPLAEPAENPFLITSSLTKGYGLSGLRCGWILAAPEIARRIWRLHDLFGSVAPHPAERMSVQAFDALPRFRARAAELLAANRPLLDSFLDAHPELECVRPRYGAIVFPRLRDGDGDAFARLLREKYETTVVPGRFFERPRHFRIGMSGETAMVRAGLERIDAALKEFRVADQGARAGKT